MKYDAFISYSHAVDGKLAPALQKNLHRLAKPWFKVKALNVFLDETSLSATPELWGTIERALLNSRYLVLLASPKAAQSYWVNKEVQFWLEHKSLDTIIIALTEGTILWDKAVGDFDWEISNAIPALLQGKYSQEPLFVDFTGIRNKNELALGNPEFKSKTVIVAATLHGKAINDLIGEDIEQYKRTIRIRNGAIAVLLILLCISGIATFYAFKQTAFAQEQQEIAEEKTRIANDSTIAAQEQRVLAQKNALMAKDSALYARQQENIARYQQSLAVIAQKNAETQRSIAETQRDSARLERDIAEANRLSAISTNLRERDPVTALRIAEQAYDKVTPPHTNASLALSAAYFEFFDSKIVPHESEIDSLEIARHNLTLVANGTKILYQKGDFSPTACLYDIASNRETILSERNLTFFYNEESGFIVTHDEDLDRINRTVHVWDMTGNLISTAHINGEKIEDIYYQNGSDQLLILSSTKKLYQAQLPDLKEMTLLSTVEYVYDICGGYYGHTCKVSNGQYFFTKEGKYLMIRNASGEIAESIKDAALERVSLNEKNIVVKRNSRLEVWDLSNGKTNILEESISVDHDRWDISFSSAGNFITGVNFTLERTPHGDNRNWLFVKVWNIQGELLLNHRFNGALARHVSISPGEKYLLLQTTNRSLLERENAENTSLGDNEQLYIFELKKNGLLLRKRTVYTLDKDTPVAQFLTEDEVIFLNSARRIEIFDINGNDNKNVLLHEKTVWELTIDRKRKLIFTRDIENLKIWNFQGELIRHIPGSMGHTLQYVTSDDLLLTHDRTTKFWYIHSQIVQNFDHGDLIIGTTVSPDQERIITYNYQQFKIWDLTGNLLATKTLNHLIEGISYIPNSHRFVVWSNRHIGLYEVDGKLLKEINTNTEAFDYYSIEGVSFSKDGKWFITHDKYGIVLHWNTTLFQHISTMVLKNGDQISRAPAAETFILGPTLFHNISKRLDTINLTSHSYWNTIGFAPGKQWLTIPSRKRAFVYDYEGRFIRKFSQHESLVRAGMFNDPNNPDRLLTYTDHTIHLWNIASGEQTLKIDAKKYKKLSSVYWAANGNIIALTENSQLPLVMWAPTGRLIMESNSHRGFIQNLILSPDKTTFITYSGRKPQEMQSDFSTEDTFTDDLDYTVKLWSANGEILANFDKNNDQITSIGFLDEGRSVYFSSLDGTLKIFPVPAQINQWLKRQQSSIPRLSREQIQRFRLQGYQDLK